MTKPLYYQVPSEADGKSLLVFLRAQGCSEKLLRRPKRQGLTVNGAFHRLIDPIQAGDQIELQPPERPSDLVPNPRLAVPVCYEDDYLVVYDKPADMLVHPAGKGFDDALANVFIAHHPYATFRPLGRLDRNTTGLCLAAKDSHSANLLNHVIDKTYFAIVQGALPQDHGVIDLPLSRLSGPQIRYQVDPAGRWAVTNYQVLRCTPSHTLVEVKLLTGRTHQIRAHFAHLGYPLAGDALYGGSQDMIRRQALHCGLLVFPHPIHHRTVTVHAPLPADMAALLATDTTKPCMP